MDRGQEGTETDRKKEIWRDKQTDRKRYGQRQTERRRYGEIEREIW
jgi:hypothetical protein